MRNGYGQGMDGKTVRLAKGNTSPFDPLEDGYAILLKSPIGILMKKSEVRQRTEIINFRVLPEERALFEDRCQNSGLSKADYFRMKCLEEKPLRKRKAPNVQTEILLKTLGQIGKVGSNLNQIAKDVNMGYLPINNELEIALNELKELRSKIRNAIGYGD